MKFFILIVICSVSFTSGYIEIVLVPGKYNPVGTRYCYSELTGTMAKGEELSLEGECRKATCEDGGGITIRRCDHIPMSPCGIQEADFTRPFPMCCPRRKRCL